MKNDLFSNDCITASHPSGLEILARSLPIQAGKRLWFRINDIARPLLPVFHLFMLVVIGSVLCAIVFANQHIPCWGDEICMLDPAYYRATTGVWHSAAQWDSFETIPFAPNYPLFINFLRLFISWLGVNFWVLRGAMIVFGIIPVFMLLWFCRRKGLLQTGTDILYASFVSACVTFFNWSVYLRPEALLLSVVTVLVFAWGGNRPVVLFLGALLVPLCGLQWNVLLLPVVLHWLIFGGRVRNPILVFSAFAVSSIATVIVYHTLGMWPSYLQEAARVGGLDVLHSALHKVRGALSAWNFGWLLNPVGFPPRFVIPAIAVLILGCIQALAPASRSSRKTIVFICLSFASVIVGLSLASMNMHYPPVIILPVCLLVPFFLRTWLHRFPLFTVLLFCAALHCAKVNWDKISEFYPPRIDGLTEARWLDEAALERVLEAELSPDDMPLATDSAWFAVRSRCRDMMPLCYAFDISGEQQKSITAVLLADEPSSILHKDGSGFRKTSYAKAMLARFCPPESPCDNPDDVRVSPEELLSAIGDHWHCTFTEIPLSQSSMNNAIHYRLFRPVFSCDAGT